MHVCMALPFTIVRAELGVSWWDTHTGPLGKGRHGVGPPHLSHGPSQVGDVQGWRPNGLWLRWTALSQASEAHTAHAHGHVIGRL